MSGLLGQFLAALESGDTGALGELLADDAITWHNTDGLEVPARQAFAGAGTLRRLVDDLRVVVISEFPVPTGIVARIELRGTVTSTGAPFCARLANFLTIVDGRVTRIDEYVDPSIRVQLGL